MGPSRELGLAIASCLGSLAPGYGQVAAPLAA